MEDGLVMENGHHVLLRVEEALRAELKPAPTLPPLMVALLVLEVTLNHCLLYTSPSPRD